MVRLKFIVHESVLVLRISEGRTRYYKRVEHLLKGNLNVKKHWVKDKERFSAYAISYSENNKLRPKNVFLLNRFCISTINAYLCNNKSRPLPVRLAYPAGHFLFMGVKYTHQAITTEEQIEILKQRGLLIDDVKRATKALDTISYFRLAGYWRHFEKDHTTRQFKDGSKFEDVLDIYSFDKELRVLLFTAIQTIEVATRTKVTKHFAHNFGPFWFMDESKATNTSRFTANLAIIRKEVTRSHDDFIKEHFRKYSEPELPPVWKMLEVVTMGTLSKLYNNFSEATAKHDVAREFGLNHHKFLRSWLECMAILRNCCAHHSRLANRVFPIKPMMPQRMSSAWITNFSFREQTLYPQLCYLVYCLNAVSPDNTFVKDFKKQLKKHPAVNPRMMGFPNDWKKEPLWKRKRETTVKKSLAAKSEEQQPSSTTNQS